MKNLKYVFTFFILSFFMINTYAQDFELAYFINGAESLKAVPNAEAINFKPDQNRIIKIIAKTGNFDVFSDTKKINREWKQRSGSLFEFSLTSGVTTGKRVEVKDKDGKILLSFIFPGKQYPKSPPPLVLKSNQMSIYELAFENTYGGNYLVSDYGITLDNQINGGYEFGGPDFSHIFIDEFGNTIKTTIPQGLADQMYVVHIIYTVNKDETANKIYAIKQTKGRFNPALRAENTREDGANVLQSAEDIDIYEKTYSLSKSTDDIEFDLMVTAEDGTKTKIESFKISMTPDYHWSVHAGLLNTWLSNPSYQLLENPVNSATKVLKRSGAGYRGVVIVSATLYTSPFTLIRYAIQKQKLKKRSSLDMKNPVPKSQKWQKSYLYERSLLDRFYPTIGVGLKDKTFENLFGGFNIEFARGGYLFLGVHYGKVNFFEKPENFEFGKTIITQAEFDLRKDEKWKINFAAGINVDFVILTNLFKL